MVDSKMMVWQNDFDYATTTNNNVDGSNINDSYK